MAKNIIETIPKNVDGSTKDEVDLDEALSIAGTGIYNIKYSLNLALFLIAAVIEPAGYSFVLPSSRCDLDMSDTQRGFIASIPYIGVVIASFPWGYLVDTRGRKNMIIYSSLVAGVLSALSAFMPNLITFILFKMLSSLCIACPASAPYSFLGEIMPPKYRDIMLSIANAMQITGAVLVPLFAWAILPLDFSVDFGLYYFRPWRLLTLLYSSVFIISAILLSFGPESPKFLISQGKHDESLAVLKKIYAGNTGKSPDDYPVKLLKIPEVNKETETFLKRLKTQSAPLLRPPYLKWMCLNGTLLFGLFATLNGLYIWIPDVLNRVFTGEIEGATACGVISQRLNETLEDPTVCTDTIDPSIYVINSIANLSCAVIGLVLGSSVKFIGKKVLLVFLFLIIGAFLISINFVIQQIVFAILLSSIPVLALTVGPINAYSVEIFPTYLRGMAVGLTMMVGRAGSVVGANVVGVLLNAACEVTFYGFGGLMILCALLSLLLPRAKTAKPQEIESSRL